MTKKTGENVNKFEWMKRENMSCSWIPENDKKKIADRMTKMKGSDQPYACFNRFEER